MLNEESTLADAKVVIEKNPKIEQALEAFFSSIEKKVEQESDGMMDEGLGDFLKSALDPAQNTVLKKIGSNKVMAAVLGTLGFAEQDAPHDVTADSIIQGFTDPKPGVLDYIGDFIDPSMLEQLVSFTSQAVSGMMEDQIAEAVMDLLAEDEVDEAAQRGEFYVDKSGSQGQNAKDGIRRDYNQAVNSKNFERFLTKYKDGNVPYKGFDQLPQAQQEILKKYVAFQLNRAAEQIKILKAAEVADKTDDTEAKQKVDDAQKELTQQASAAEDKVDKAIEQSSDVDKENQVSPMRTAIKSFLDMNVDNTEKAKKHFDVLEASTRPQDKKLINTLKAFFDADENKRKEALPDPKPEEEVLVKLLEPIVKGEEPEAQQADQLDTKAAEDKYGEALKALEDKNDIKAVLIFLQHAIDLKILKETKASEVLKDILKISEDQYKEIFAKMDNQSAGRVVAILKDETKSKIVINAMKQAASPDQQDQEQDDKEEKPEQKPQGIGKVDFTKLKEAYDGFAGREGDKRNDSFFYPNDNTRLTQAKKLQALYFQIRILLKLDIEDLDQIAAAINDDSLSADVTVDTPANKTKETEAGAEGETEGDGPAKRDLYEQKIVELRSLTTLRDLIRDAEFVVSEYERVVTTGIRGSKQLYSKYSSQLGKDAYNPKKVLYNIVLKDIVKIANAFIATLDSAVKKYRGPNPIAEAMLEEPWDNVVAKVKAVFQKTVSRGQKLIQLMVDHKPESDAPTEIRSVGDEIYKDLTTILEYYPLSKPFETDAHGAEGFAMAARKLNNMFQMVNTLASQFQNNEKIASLEQPAKVRLHSKMEELKQLVIDTFAGEYDPKPSINDETSEEAFKNPAKDEEGDKPSVDNKEVSDYLNQEDSFYQKVIQTLDGFEAEDSAFFGQSLQENVQKAIQSFIAKTIKGFRGPPDAVKFLQTLRAKIEQFEKKVEADKKAAQTVQPEQGGEGRAEMTIDRRNTMKLYAQLLRAYKKAYEQFKSGNYEAKDLQKTVKSAITGSILRSGAAKDLDKAVTKYANFYMLVEYYIVTLTNDKADPSILKNILEAFKTGTNGIIKKLPSGVTTGRSQASTQLKKIQTRKSAFFKSSGGDSRIATTSLATKVGNFIGSGLNRIASKFKIDLDYGSDMSLQEETPKADPRVTTQDSETSQPQNAEAVFKKMADLMKEFVGDYSAASAIEEDIAEYSKNKGDKITADIERHIKQLERVAKQLHVHILNNYEALESMTDSVFTQQVGAAGEKKEKEAQQVAGKYKSVLSQVNDGEEKEALERVLMFLTGEMSAGGTKIQREVVNRIIESEILQFGFTQITPSLLQEIKKQLKSEALEWDGTSFVQTTDKMGDPEPIDTDELTTQLTDLPKQTKADAKAKAKAKANQKKRDKSTEFGYLLQKFKKEPKDIKAFLHAQGYKAEMYDRLEALFQDKEGLFDQTMKISGFYDTEQTTNDAEPDEADVGMVDIPADYEPDGDEESEDEGGLDTDGEPLTNYVPNPDSRNPYSTQQDDETTPKPKTRWQKFKSKFGFEESLQQDLELEQQLTNKLKPIIQEMMRGQNG